MTDNCCIISEIGLIINKFVISHIENKMEEYTDEEIKDYICTNKPKIDKIIKETTKDTRDELSRILYEWYYDGGGSMEEYLSDEFKITEKDNASCSDENL
jgi:hypothetical protein